MNLQPAQRKHAKMKMAVQGVSGSGKTYSSLVLAYGLCQDWSKIAVIDTENHSSDLYAHLGKYNVLHLTPPYTPERFMEALSVCEQAGMEVIIPDSITHEWEYLLDYHANLPGNSFTAWAKVTPRHNAFVQALLQSPAHIICTIRTKSDYVLTDKNGKLVPEKVGLKTVQRDGLEYDFTLVFELDIKNNATTSKDRTGLFFGKPEQKITERTGLQIRQWCNSGTEESPFNDVTVDDVLNLMASINNVQDLYALYNQHPSLQALIKKQFEMHRISINQQSISSPTNLNDHGKYLNNN